MLIERGADIHFRVDAILGLTPLHYAARWVRLEVARLLIREGAGIDSRDMDGNTPLCSAIKGEKLFLINRELLTTEEQRLPMVRLLLAERASVSA